MSARCRSLLAVLALLFAPTALAQTPLGQHMQRMLTTGDQWRTPNPDFDPASGGAEAYGLTFELAPDGSHVSGYLTGIHPDGRQAIYWTLLSFYNPVIERVIVQQVGWNGALLRGEVPVQPGTTQLVDMIHYGADGKLDYSRHDNRFDAPGRHRSIVLKPDGHGGWQETQRWTWTREPLDRPVAAQPAQLAEPLVPHAGFLLAGSGRWRALNPDWAPGADTARHYGMNFRAGPHGHHVAGEIVSIFESGERSRAWSLFITFNPVTRQAWMEQTGASGVYFRGELGLLESGRRTHAGVVYMPDGMARSVRDEIEILDASSYRSHVFEREPDGSWKKAREWTWTLQAEAPAD